MVKLFNVIETYKGRESVLFTGPLTKCNARLKAIRASKVKGRTYRLEEAGPDDEKHSRKPTGSYSGGDCQTPRLTKWK